MDTQYVVEFDCTTKQGGVDGVFNTIVDHACHWLNRDLDSGTVAAAGVLESAGSVVDRRGRRKQWEPIISGTTQCLFLTIDQPLQNSEVAKFVTELTIYGDDDVVRLRVEMGRETAGIMRPATIEELHKPQLLDRLCRERSLELRRRGQVVEDRWVPIATDFKARLLVEIVAELDRLPILVVDGDNPGAPLFGQLVSRELVGLVRVAMVRNYLIPSLNEELKNYGAQLPINGAVLVWPDAKSVRRHPQYTQDDIERGWFANRDRRLNTLVGSLMRMLAPLSVVANGPNQLLAAARRAQTEATRVQREEHLRAQIDAATAATTSEEKVTRLEELLESQQSENEQLWAEIAQLEQQNKADLARMAKDYALGYAQQGQPSVEHSSQGFDLVPELDDDDLTALASYLSTASDGAIVFTESAYDSWRDNDYPYVDKMQAALVALARAATSYREAGGRTNVRFTDWMHDNFGVRMSSHDDALQETGLDTFEYENVTYSRIPHIKLDDNTTPDRVGRVYFAIDNANLRFIVDHVGLKLYGV